MLTTARIKLLLRYQDELYDFTMERATKYLKRLGVKRGPNGIRFRDGGIEIEYNDSCSCHPEISTEWMSYDCLTDPDWEAETDKMLAHQAEQKRIEEAQKQSTRARLVEDQERATWEKLKLKFEGAKS